MNRSLRARLVLLTLLVVSLALTSVLSLSEPAEAACSTTNCGPWTGFDCCSGNTKLYQYRLCCGTSGSCCYQYRCITAACPT